MSVSAKFTRLALLSMAVTCMTTTTVLAQSDASAATQKTIDISGVSNEAVAKNKLDKKIAKEMKQLTKKLELTDQQQDTIGVLLRVREETISSARGDKENRSEFRQIREDAATAFTEAVKPLLNPKQLETFEKMQNNKSMRQNIRSVDPADFSRSNSKRK